MRLPRRPFRKFSLSLLLFAGGLLLVFLTVNTRVNPLWVSSAPWTDEGYAEYRPIYRFQRTGKAGIADSQPWKVGFFGSSRVDIAFDPALPQWEGKPAVNLAVSAGTLPETAPIVHYVMERSPLDIAIVGIDIGDLMGPGSAYRTTGFMESPFNPGADRVEQELRYHLGVSTFQSAVQTIINRGQKDLPEYTPQGHRLRHPDHQQPAMVIERDAIPHALRSVRRRKIFLTKEADQWKSELLTQILEETKAAGTRLVLVIPPSHATYQGVFFHEGDPDPGFASDRIAITRLVAESNDAHPDAPQAEIWDFNDFHPFNAEPVPLDKEGRMRWWLDGTHARKQLGDVMLARIMGWPVEPGGENFGFKLTRENVAQREAEISAGYDHFRTSQPELWQWMSEAIGKYQDSPKAKADQDEGEAGPAEP